MELYNQLVIQITIKNLRNFLRIRIQSEVSIFWEDRNKLVFIVFIKSEFEFNF